MYQSELNRCVKSSGLMLGALQDYSLSLNIGQVKVGFLAQSISQISKGNCYSCNKGVKLNPVFPTFIQVLVLYPLMQVLHRLFYPVVNKLKDIFSFTDLQVQQI